MLNPLNQTVVVTNDELFSPMEWETERFGVGIRQLDDQHKHLLNLINHFSQITQVINNRLLSASEAGPGGTKRKKTLGATSASHIVIRQFDPALQAGSALHQEVEKLVTYCAKNLIAEDQLIDTYGYADRQAHQLEHDLFVKETSKLLHMMDNFNVEIKDAKRYLSFLKLWMVEHIPKDRQLAHYLLEKGVGT